MPDKALLATCNPHKTPDGIKENFSLGFHVLP
uniref:Uncharacterized protein n=1 Tax=Arundo donax TaxID=35708 RepID=A0A0A9D0S4_ARUDO